MNIKKYIMQGLLPLLAAGFICTSVISCSEEEVPNNMAPTLNVSAVSNALRTSAILSGSISGQTSQIKDFGFEYSTSQDFPSDKTSKISMSEEGATSSLSTQVKNLTPNERYYYRMYATTGVTNIYSAVQDFRTTNMSAAQMSAMTVDSIGENYARFSFTIEDIGNEVLIECGVSYKKSDSKAFIPVAIDNPTSGTQCVVEITDLDPDTDYNFRPYAKNAADREATTGSIEGFGTTITQKTAALLSASVETGVVDEGDIKITSVRMTGTIQSAVGSNGVINECGFVYSLTNSLPTYNSDSKIINDATGINVTTKPYTYSGDITGLSQSTHCYVRAYARNTVTGEERIAYGTVREITTAQLKKPVVEINSEGITTTATTIKVSATITNYDANALVEKGIIWSKTQGDLSLADAKTAKTYQVVTTGENQIVATIEGLDINTSYFIRAYAVYKSGEIMETGYTSSSNQTRTDGFILPNIDLETNQDQVEFGSIELVGKISSSGNTTITERGFVVSSISSEPTLENYEKTAKSNESFTSTITGLKPQTWYYARAYVKCELAGRKETTYGGWGSFYTYDFDRPSFSSMEYVETTASSVTIKNNVTPGKDGTIVARGFCVRVDDEKHLAPTVDDIKVEEAVTDATTGNTYTLTLSNLVSGITYYVQPYVIVQIGSEKHVCYRHSIEAFVTKRIPGQDDNVSPDKKD